MKRNKPVNVNVIILFKILLASVAKAKEIHRGRDIKGLILSEFDKEQQLSMMPLPN